MKKLIFNALRVVIRHLRKINNANDLKMYNDLYPAETVNKRRFYNIGAGDFSHPAWTNIDGCSDEIRAKFEKNGRHIYHDLFDRKAIPVTDNSAEIVYTSHTIEHVDNTSVDFLFRDVYRLLRPGGVFRIVTPDTLLAYEAWRRNDRYFYPWVMGENHNYDAQSMLMNVPFNKASLTQIFLEEFASQASTITTVGGDKRITDEEFENLFKTMTVETAFDYCISLCSIEIQKNHTFRHINWFHEKKLTSMLAAAGFSQIDRSAYLQSKSPVLRNHNYFDQTLPMHSIFMEAVK